MPAPKNKRYHYVYYSYESWGRGYIGVRSCNCPPIEDRKYFGNYKDKTFKPDNKIILQEFSCREDAQKAEIDLHGFFCVDINQHFANKARARSTGFSCGYSRKISEKTKRKIGEANKKALKGKKLSEEVKRKISEHFKGKPLTDEHKEKIRNAQINRKFSDEHLKNLRESLKNRKFSDEVRSKMGWNKRSVVLKNTNTGEILSFPSRTAAGKALNISTSTISSAINRGQKLVCGYEFCANL